MAKVQVIQSAPNIVTVTQSYTTVSVTETQQDYASVDITEQKTYVSVQATIAGTEQPQHYTHTQNQSSAEWVIFHGLNTRPSVDVVNSTGVSVFPTIQYNDLNTVTITFSSPQSGSAYFN
tara:strand:- start:11062 stop:11421 length:360 start_codon:yes stop_codon:yes gene_type:complete